MLVTHRAKIPRARIVCTRHYNTRVHRFPFFHQITFSISCDGLSRWYPGNWQGKRTTALANISKGMKLRRWKQTPSFLLPFFYRSFPASSCPAYRTGMQTCNDHVKKKNLPQPVGKETAKHTGEKKREATKHFSHTVCALFYPATFQPEGRFARTEFTPPRQPLQDPLEMHFASPITAFPPPTRSLFPPFFAWKRKITSTTCNTRRMGARARLEVLSVISCFSVHRSRYQPRC